MTRQYSLTTRTIGIATLIVFLSTQIAFADGTFYSAIRSQQPENAQAVGMEIANALGGEFKAQAPASGAADKAKEFISKTSVFLYKVSPFLFAGIMIRQLIFSGSSPVEIRIVGAGLAVTGFLAGKFGVHKILQKPISKRRLWAWSAASIYTFINVGIAFPYLVAGEDLLHDCRYTASQMLWYDREFGRTRNRVRLFVRPQKILKSGIIAQPAAVRLEGRLGNYEDSIYSVEINPDSFAINLVTAKPGDSKPVEKLAGEGSVAMMNGGYYHKYDEDKFFPTGLVIRDGEPVSDFKEPGNRGSFQAILVRVGGKIMILPSSYFSQHKYPFDSKTRIDFALQAGPLAVFNGGFNELSEHYHGDGRALSAVFIDDHGEVYFLASEGGNLFYSTVLSLINRFFKGLIGPDYENTARFADQMLSQRGRRLVSFMYVDGGGSSFVGVRGDDGRLIRKGPGYHPVVNILTVTSRLETEPVNYLLSLMRTGTDETIQKAIEGIDRLSQPENKTQEEFQKILSGIRTADPKGMKKIFNSISRDQLKNLVGRHAFVGQMLAELVPYKALGVFGINRRLSAKTLADNVNRVSGMPIRNLVERELILALRRYTPEEKFALLNSLDQTTWQWLEGLDTIIRGYPELMRIFRANVPAAVEVVCNATNNHCENYIGRLITSYSRSGDRTNLNFIFGFLEELSANPSRYGRQFQETARWLLLCDTNISQPFLEAYLDSYGDEGAGFFIAVGLGEDTSIRAVDNLRVIAKESPELRPVITSILKEKLIESSEARAVGAAILAQCL